MTFSTILLANFLASVFGTFLANLSLLYIIGRKAEAVERKRQQIAQKLYQEAVEEYKEEYNGRVKRAEEYIRMES